MTEQVKTCIDAILACDIAGLVDSLQGIAQALYGDSSLWYKIAEANGLSAAAALVEGQTLVLPTGVMNSKNNAGTFKPYNAGEAIGDLSPTTPQPPKKPKCGTFGLILLAVIAVAVTAITAGAALAAAAPGIGGFASGLSTVLGTSVLGGTVAAGGIAGALGGGLIGALGAVAIGAGSAAVGSIVSQGVGVATGIQDKFSWKGVAFAALSAGIAGGVGAIAPGGGWLASAGRAVASSAISQGVGVATGLQDKFSWAGVAAAGIGSSAGDLVGANVGGGQVANFAASVSASAIANAATRSAINGESFGKNLVAALPDVIASILMKAVGVASGLDIPQIISPGRSADRITDGIKSDLRNLQGGILTPQQKKDLAVFEKEVAVEIAEARRIEVADPQGAVVIQERALQKAVSFYPAHQQQQAAALIGLRSSAPPPSDIAETGDDSVIIITGQRIEPEYGAAFGLLDRPSVYSGRLKKRAEGAVAEVIEKIPGGSLALKTIDWGLTIAGGPARFVAGKAYEAIQGKAVEKTTQVFDDSGYGGITSSEGGEGLPWLAAVALGSVKISSLGRGKKDAPQLTRLSLSNYLSNVSTKTHSAIATDLQGLGLKIKGQSPDGRFISFVDKSGRVRAQLHPADKVTTSPHLHIYDARGNQLDANLNRVPRTSPDAHIQTGGY